MSRSPLSKFSFLVPIDLGIELRRISKETGIPLTAMFVRACWHVISEYRKEQIKFAALEDEYVSATGRDRRVA